MNTSVGQHGNEFERLVSLLCDGSLASAEFKRLEQLALGDASLRRQYIERMNLHAALGWNRAKADIENAGAEDVNSWPMEQVDAVVRQSRTVTIDTAATKSWRQSVLLSTAVVAAAFYGVFAALAWNLQPFFVPAQSASSDQGVASLVASKDSSPETFVARLVSAEGCRWLEPAGQLEVKQRLTPQLLELETGTAEIAFASGVHAVIQGPCTFELRSPSAAFLSSGSVIAHVPTAAVGFTVETPSARVVDLGTEFGVEVNESGDTALHVFSGAVDIHSCEKPDSARPEPVTQRRVTAGESVRVVSNSAAIASESHAPERFVHRPGRHTRRFAPPSLIVFPAAASVTESSSMNVTEYPASAAIDGDVETFSHTTGGEANPWWKLDLTESCDVAVVVLQNRVNCCGGRLRDVVVSLLAEDGKTVVARSPLLNRDNSWGGGIADFERGPSQIVFDTTQTNGSLARARFVIVERAIPVAPARTHHDNALSLAEVQVFKSKLISVPAAASNQAN